MFNVGLNKVLRFFKMFHKFMITCISHIFLMILGHFPSQGISYADWMDCNVNVTIPISKKDK